MSMPYRVEDSAVGRFYESVITGTDGSQLTYYMQERSEAGEVEIKYGQGLVHGVKAVDKVCFFGNKPSNDTIFGEKIEDEMA